MLLLKRKSTLETDNLVHIEDVKIPPDFARTKCRQSKIDRAKRYYLEHKQLDKPITVIPEINEKGFPNKLLLVNGYSRYLAAKRLCLNKVPVKYIDINTYYRNA